LRIDLLALLDELRAMAGTGLTYATDPYDRDRYERLSTLVTEGYAAALDLPPAEVRAALARDLGYVTSKVGVDGAIFDDEDRLLLVQRADDQRWGLVSGWVDVGEDPAATIVRELREEVGLVANIDALIGVYGRQASAEYGPHGAVAVVYACTVEPGPITLQPHEVLDAAYRDVDSVDAWHKNHEDYARAALAWRHSR
jgi:ADP-ribose pyrophosphatase YjhB (NUDIX family)